MFFFSSRRKNRTVVQKQILKKNTKEKSKNENNDSDVQSKADSDGDGHSETVIGKAPPQKEKHSLHFVIDSQNPAHAMKSGYNVENVSCGFTLSA